MPGMEEQRPIGWWVKRLDAVLEEALDHAVAGEGLTRRHWQVLHSLVGGAGRENALRDALADFPGDVGAVVADMVGRGWVDRRTDEVELTPDGRAAHDRAAAVVGRVRKSVADGLSAQEYERTVLVLGRMVENVQRALRDR
jgi:DNA-binding MarR family transcriptional regulator